MHYYWCRGGEERPNGDAGAGWGVGGGEEGGVDGVCAGEGGHVVEEEGRGDDVCDGEVVGGEEGGELRAY